MPRRPRQPPRRPSRKLYLGEWLSRLGKRPAGLAKAINRSESYISLLISGDRKGASTVILLEISEYLGITVNDLFRPPPSADAVKAAGNLSPGHMAALSDLLDQLKKQPK